MLNVGYDFEDPAQFREEIFKTKFNECSGMISWIQNSNDRQAIVF
jgi:hypothetical protein